MIKGKTATGFDFEIDPEALDDWELIKILRKIDAGDQMLIVDAFPMLLGQQQTERLEAHLKEIKGRTKISDMVAAFADIMSSCQSTKK